MGLFSKLKSTFSNNNQSEEIISKLNNEISSLKEEISRLNGEEKGGKEKSNIVVMLKKEIENLKSKIESYKGEINFEFIDNEIESKIIEQLSLAQKEVNIAMAWLTSSNLISKLEDLKNNGKLINLVVDNNISNKMDDLKRVSTKLYVTKIDKEKEKNIMHNKYCIIDNNIVIDGSYNWSNNAKGNDEHIIILNNKKIAEKYKENFDKLIEKYNSN